MSARTCTRMGDSAGMLSRTEFKDDGVLRDTSASCAFTRKDADEKTRVWVLRVTTHLIPKLSEDDRNVLELASVRPRWLNTPPRNRT